MKELLLLAHPTFGVLGIITAVWVVVEAFNASAANESRITTAAWLTAAFMALAWIAGGYFYVVYYAVDKAIILAGPWPFAHSFFMEGKEHLFFVTLILSFLLPIAARAKNLASNRTVRTTVITIAALVILSGLAIEGAGAVIALGVRLGLQAGIH